MGYSYTDFQLLVHTQPDERNRFLGGGRGGGKSVAAAQDISITARRYGSDARILYLRTGPYQALTDFIETCQRHFSEVWGVRNHHINRSTHTWTLPTGTYFELGILPDGKEGLKHYEKKYQGRSFTDLLVDEAQQWATSTVLDLMTSNMRGPIRKRRTFMANPGGIGHQWLASRFVNTGSPIWSPFKISRDVKLFDGRIVPTTHEWVSCPSTYRDNPHNDTNDGRDYLAALASACNNDEELLKAWIDGNWNISRGAYFATVLANPHVEMLWPRPEDWTRWEPHDWRFWLGFDHGTSSPAACYVMGKSPGAIGPDGRYYPAGSILLLDEYVCYRPGDLSKAYGWTVPEIAGYVRALAKRWNITPSGVADDACFGETGHQDTIAGEYAKAGVVWRPAHKGRRAPRFQMMKRLLAAAGRVDEAGMYVSKHCRYWWETVPFIVTDPDDPEVPMKCGTDHGLDASSYGMSGGDRTSGVMQNVS